MNKHLAPPKRQAGFTLVELGIVAAIGFMLSGIALYKAPILMANYRSTAEIGDLPQIVTNIQKSYINAATFQNVTLDSIIRLDAFPANRVTVPGAGAATATNRWTGAITFAVGTITTANDTGRLVYSGIPSSECRQVALGVAPAFRRIFVDNANSGTVGAGTMVKAVNAAVDEGLVATACTGNQNSLTFDFTK